MPCANRGWGSRQGISCGINAMGVLGTTRFLEDDPMYHRSRTAMDTPKEMDGPNGCRVVLWQVFFNALDIRRLEFASWSRPGHRRERRVFRFRFFSPTLIMTRTPATKIAARHGGAGQPRHLHRRKSNGSSIGPVEHQQKSIRQRNSFWHTHWHGQVQDRRAAVTTSVSKSFPLSAICQIATEGLHDFLGVKRATLLQACSEPRPHKTRSPGPVDRDSSQNGLWTQKLRHFIQFISAEH